MVWMYFIDCMVGLNILTNSSLLLLLWKQEEFHSIPVMDYGIFHCLSVNLTWTVPSKKNLFNVLNVYNFLQALKFPLRTVYLIKVEMCLLGCIQPVQIITLLHNNKTYGYCILNNDITFIYKSSLNGSIHELITVLMRLLILSDWQNYFPGVSLKCLKIFEFCIYM